jgi:hypothetical protein
MVGRLVEVAVRAEDLTVLVAARVGRPLPGVALLSLLDLSVPALADREVRQARVHTAHHEADGEKPREPRGTPGGAIHRHEDTL